MYCMFFNLSVNYERFLQCFREIKIREKQNSRGTVERYQAVDTYIRLVLEKVEKIKNCKHRLRPEVSKKFKGLKLLVTVTVNLRI